MTVERVPCENCGNMVASTSRLCPYCKSTSPNGGRNLLIAIVGIPILIIGIASGVMQSHHSTSSNSAASISGADTTRAGRDVRASEVGSPGSTEASVETSPPASSDPPDEGEPPEKSLSPSRGIDIGGPQMRAVLSALDEGQPSRWQARDRAGYAVASSAQAYNDRICKTYRVTADKGDVLFDRLACKTDGGSWDLDAKR